MNMSKKEEIRRAYLTQYFGTYPVPFRAHYQKPALRWESERVAVAYDVDRRRLTVTHKATGRSATVDIRPGMSMTAMAELIVAADKAEGVDREWLRAATGETLMVIEK